MYRSFGAIIALFLVSFPNAVSLGTVQSVAVSGKLLCNNKPYANAKVKLYEVDFADPDDLMAQGFSKKDGTFVLEGSETEVGQIEPKLNIYHNCNDEQVECLRKIQIKIPADYIAEGQRAKKTFNAGELNLNAIYPGESRDCIN